MGLGFMGRSVHGRHFAAATGGAFAFAAHRSTSVVWFGSGSRQMGDGEEMPSVEANLICVT